MTQFLGTLSPVGRNDESDIDDAAHSTAKDSVGALRLIRVSESSPYYSVIKYYKAMATVSKGMALIRDTAAANPNNLKHAATANGQQLPAGIAAADVSNTGYFSYAYIYGYCPAAKVGTSLASDTPLKLGASIAGYLSVLQANATLVDATVPVFFAENLGLNAGTTGLSPITIKVWLA